MLDYYERISFCLRMRLLKNFFQSQSLTCVHQTLIIPLGFNVAQVNMNYIKHNQSKLPAHFCTCPVFN